MRWLVRLYPEQWRRRYGAELEQLVQDLGASVSRTALAVDLVRGAVDAHIQQEWDMQPADLKAVRRGVLIAAVTWLGLATEILLSNVVFPTKTDNDTVPVLASYLCVFAVLFLVGALAARGGASVRGQVLAGLVAGVLIGALTIATFAVVDNVWLDVVARQQSKVDGFAHSGAASMRDYVNNGLVGGVVFLVVGLGIAGAVLGRAGGTVGRAGDATAVPPG